MRAYKKFTIFLSQFIKVLAESWKTIFPPREGVLTEEGRRILSNSKDRVKVFEAIDELNKGEKDSIEVKTTYGQITLLKN